MPAATGIQGGEGQCREQGEQPRPSAVARSSARPVADPTCLTSGLSRYG